MAPPPPSPPAGHGMATAYEASSVNRSALDADTYARICSAASSGHSGSTCGSACRNSSGSVDNGSIMLRKLRTMKTTYL